MAFGSNKRRCPADDDVVEEVDREVTEDTTNNDVDGAAGGGDPIDDDGYEEDDAQNGTENPIFAEVTFLNTSKGKNDGGTRSWRCNHCKHSYRSSSTRIRMHFFGTQNGKKSPIGRCEALRSNCEKYQELYDKFNKANEKRDSSKSNSGAPKRPLQDAFGLKERDAVDLSILECMAANGVPFNIFRSPFFAKMVTAINNAPKGYKAPSSEKARTTLLDACKRKVENDLSGVKDTWLTQGVSIVSDGWTNVKNQTLLNVIAANSSGSCFLYAVDYSGVEKTGEAIAQFLLKAIEDIGPVNVLQVVTDNASNCKAAGKIIEKVYPHIFWTPCACHTLNLVFKDLAKKFTWMEDTYKTGKAIVNFFRGHLNCLAMFRNNSCLELLRVGKTRFASNYIMLERLNNCREALATTVVTKQWKDWMKGCSNEQNMETKAIVKAINDDDFWSEVETILAITEPIFSVLRFCDGEGPKIGEIYERMDTMIGKIKDIMYKDGNLHKSDYSEIEDIIFSWWEKMNTPLQCLAYALSPRYYDKVYLEKEAPGGFRRKPPNEDLEVMEGVMEALRRVADSDHEYTVLRSQYNDFVMKRGMFALPAVKLDAGTMDPIKWWFSYGAQTLNLATVAARVLSQPVSSSSAERLWSTFGYIHSAKRNKLNVKTADKLVYIHHNLRLLSRAAEGYKNGAHASWDANPEDSLI